MRMMLFAAVGANSLIIGPEAVDDTVSTLEGAAITFGVLANDTHPNSLNLTLQSASVDAAEGTVTANVDDTVTYTPADGFTGQATITYVVEDENGLTDTGTLTVNVSADPLPIANSDSDTTNEGVAIQVDLLANDTHEGTDNLTVISVSVDEGTVVDDGGGLATYTPAQYWNGTATITYTIEDENGDQDTNTHTILVIPVEGVPTGVDDTGTMVENTSVTFDVLANDTHSEIENLHIDSASVDVGSVTIVSDELVVTPPTDYVGTVVVTYVVEDENGDQATATLTITVTADPVPTANADSASVQSGSTVTIDVLSNDTHSTDTLFIASASVDAAEGTVSIVSDQLQFTADAAFTGTATITYTVEDATGDQDTSTVSVTVSADPVPTAVSDTATTPESTMVVIDVLANDTHATDTLTVEAASVVGTDGTVVINGSDQLEFTPADNFVGTATVNYTVEDSNGDQASSTVSVTVTSISPVAVNDTATTTEDTLVTVDVLANDTHSLAGETLTIDSVTLNTPAEGTAVVNAGQIDFTPASGVTGTVVMTYVVSDETGDTDTGTLTVTVNAAATGPDPFDEPASTAIALMIDGSTSGVGKTNCNLWSNKTGIAGAGDACEWRTNSGTREEVDLRIADDFTTDDYWVRCRFKVTTAGTSKTYVQFNNEYMSDYDAWFDITDDSTAAAARVLSHSASISDAVCDKHPTDGFIYVKFRLNFSAETDANGTNTLNMSDQDHTGDGLMDVNNLTVVNIQDYTFELIT